jgi:hypothetical protein
MSEYWVQHFIGFDRDDELGSEYVSHMFKADRSLVETMVDRAEQDSWVEMPDAAHHVDTFCGKSNVEPHHLHSQRVRPLAKHLAVLGHDRGVEGEAPETVCSTCWQEVKSDMASDAPSLTETGDATRYRWKVKGEARSVWADLIVPDVATFDDVQSAVSGALGLHDQFHGWAFTDHPRYMKANIEVSSGRRTLGPGELDASELSGKEALDVFELDTGEKLYYLYDLGTPAVTYGLLKERVDVGSLDDEAVTATYGAVRVTKQKGSESARY